MKKTILNTIFGIYLVNAVFVTVCLLSYNQFKVTEFGNYSLVIVTDNEMIPDYNEGDLLILDKSVPVFTGDKAFFYDTYNRQIEVKLGEIQDLEKVTETESTYTFEGDHKVSSEYVLGGEISASVIPVIFASTLLSLPTTILQFVETSGKTISEWWYTIFSYQKPIGFAIYIILIFVSAFFYSFLQIDPDKMADNLKKQNAHIPGVKPGEETAVFISKVLFKVTLLGATYLAVLASIPVIVTFIFPELPASVQIGGTSLMIVVGVALETIKQIKTEGQAQDYHGFL